MLLSLATTGGSVEVTGRGRRLGREMGFHGAKKKTVVARWRRRRPSRNAKINSGLKTLVAWRLLWQEQACFFCVCVKAQFWLSGL